MLVREPTITLWDWLAVSDELAAADLIFLFGGATIEIAAKAVEIYQHGFSPHIVASGNTGTFSNPDWVRPEADIFAHYLRKQGIPGSAVTVQNRSTNTLEDAVFSLAAVDARGVPHSSVIIISRPVHQRRAYATYQHQDPNAKLLNAPCHEPRPQDLDDDGLHAVAIRCLQEYERLLRYAAQGNLTPQPIPEEVLQAYNKLKSIIGSV